MTGFSISGKGMGRLGAAGDRGYTVTMTALATLPSTPSVAIADWSALETELDCWAAKGRTATFWWRDDDAIAWTPELERLLALAGDTPLALAVIPGRAEGALASRLASFATVCVLQHGWQHTNHTSGSAKSEFGGERPLRQRLDELAAGRERMASLFGAQARPVLVPPWNRIARDLVPHLPGIDICGLSVASPRPAAEPFPGLRLVNIHADLVDWHGERGFIGETAAIDLVLRHLGNRRLGRADSAEPTGILTHHLVQDAATERFLDRLLVLTRSHRAARFVPIAELFTAS